MMDHCTTKGFIIHAKGDPSVGIPSSTWTLDGDLNFQDIHDMEDFKRKLVQAFEFACPEPVKVTAVEELDGPKAATEVASEENSTPSETKNSLLR